MSTTVAGNILNEIISGDAPLVARVAVWIAFYPLMRTLSVELDHLERTIAKRYEPIWCEEPPEDFERAVVVE